MVSSFVRSRVLLLVAACVAGAIACRPAAARSLAEIRAEGVVSCGGAARPGLSLPSVGGEGRGLEPDICRAVSVAVLGPDARVVFHYYGMPADPLWPDHTDDIAFLTASEMLARPGLGASLPGPPVFVLSQLVAVADASPIRHLADLGPALVCIEPGTPTERNFGAYLRDHRSAAQMFMFQEDEERQDAFQGGRCDAIAGEAPSLAAMALAGAQDDRRMRLLPEPFAAVPLFAVTPTDDARWSAIVAWTVHTLIAGGPARLPLDPAALGLAADWQQAVMSAVGSYSDILDRNLGARSPLHLPPGLNARWSEGGASVPGITE